MPFDVGAVINRRQGESLTLHAEHVNPQFAKVVEALGLDRAYTRGEGQYLYDREGRQYLDFLSGFGVFNVGRNHPLVRKALTDFLDGLHPTLVQMDAPLLSGVLAEKLKSLVPRDLSLVYFTTSGTESVETAIKFARRATGRPRLLYCQNAFHGLSLGSLSLNGEPWFRDGFEPLLAGCDAVPLHDLEALHAELAKEDVAAFVLEPVQSKGVHVAECDYVRQACELCRRYGTLFALDEILTGFGRTGKMFAFEHAGVVPDLLILSNAISGGFVPVGAVLTRKDVHDKVFSPIDRCNVHSSTFGQGALAMVAGLATLSVMEDAALGENAARMGELLVDGLHEVGKRHELIREVRGQGLLLAIELGRPNSWRRRLGWDAAHKINSGFFSHGIVVALLRDHGILVPAAGHGLEALKLIPPLCINESDVARFLEAFEDVLWRARKFPGPFWDMAIELARNAFR